MPVHLASSDIDLPVFGTAPQSSIHVSQFEATTSGKFRLKNSASCAQFPGNTGSAIILHQQTSEAGTHFDVALPTDCVRAVYAAAGQSLTPQLAATLSALDALPTCANLPPEFVPGKSTIAVSEIADPADKAVARQTNELTLASNAQQLHAFRGAMATWVESQKDVLQLATWLNTCTSDISRFFLRHLLLWDGHLRLTPSRACLPT